MVSHYQSGIHMADSQCFRCARGCQAADFVIDLVLFGQAYRMVELNCNHFFPFNLHLQHVVCMYKDMCTVWVQPDWSSKLCNLWMYGELSDSVWCG